MCRLFSSWLEKDINSGYCFYHWSLHYTALATMQIISVETELIEFLILLPFS